MFCISCQQLYNTRSSPGDKRSTIVPPVFCGSPVDKKTWRLSATSKTSDLNLSPQIIVGGSVFEAVLRTVFIEHALEDRHVAGSHVDYLKANVIRVWIHMVLMAPFAAGNKRHG